MLIFIYFLLIKDSVDDRSTLFISVEHKAYEHDQSEDKEIVERLELIRVECGEDHKQTRADREGGEYKSLYGVHPLRLYHHIDKDRDIHSVEGNDGKLVIFPGDDCGELTADKTELPLEHPYGRDHKSNKGGSDGHITLFI